MKHPAEAKPSLLRAPKFDPWVGRVRLIRAAVAAMAFMLVAILAYTGGIPLADALIRGIAVSLVSYFVAWGGALWLCSELYFAQVNGMRQRLQEAEEARARQMEEFYRSRLAAAGTTPEEVLDTQQRPAA